MGSAYTVKIAGTNLPLTEIDALKAELDRQLKEVNRQMSHYLPDSELSRFNRRSGQPALQGVTGVRPGGTPGAGPEPPFPGRP